MSKPDMMAHLRALPLGLRGMGIGDPDEGGRIEAAEVVRWAIGEIEQLRLAIRRLAEQDATLSVCDDAVTVTMDATLTDAQRESVERAAVWMMTLAQDRKEIQSAAYLADDAATLRALLERHAP